MTVLVSRWSAFALNLFLAAGLSVFWYDEMLRHNMSNRAGWSLLLSFALLPSGWQGWVALSATVVATVTSTAAVLLLARERTWTQGMRLHYLVGMSLATFIGLGVLEIALEEPFVKAWPVYLVAIAIVSIWPLLHLQMRRAVRSVNLHPGKVVCKQRPCPALGDGGQRHLVFPGGTLHLLLRGDAAKNGVYMTPAKTREKENTVEPVMLTASEMQPTHTVTVGETETLVLRSRRAL